MQLLAKSRALPSGVLNLAVEEWKGCARGQQMKNSSLLCFLSGVCRGTCWQLLVWQHSLSPQLLPRGCGTWQGLQAGAASSGALQASCRSVLPQQVGRRCLQTFTQPSAWCRLDGHCIPWASSVARQVPAKDLLALPHTVVPVMSAGKEPGAGWFCSPAPSLLLGVELIGYHCQTIYIIPSKPRNQGAADTCFSCSCPTEPQCHAVPQGPPSEVCCPELQTSELARGLCCLSWPVPGHWLEEGAELGLWWG